LPREQREEGERESEDDEAGDVRPIVTVKAVVERATARHPAHEQEEASDEPLHEEGEPEGEEEHHGGSLDGKGEAERTDAPVVVELVDEVYGRSRQGVNSIAEFDVVSSDKDAASRKATLHCKSDRTASRDVLYASLDVGLGDADNHGVGLQLLGYRYEGS
jgi:hypothetical protein